MSDAPVEPGDDRRVAEIDPASRGAPAQVGGAVATGVAVLAGLGVGVALGTPVATVVALLGALLLATGGQLVGDDDGPGRLAAGSALLTGGATLGVSAPWLIVGPTVVQVVALLGTLLATFAAATDALGGFVDGGDGVGTTDTAGSGVTSGAVGTLYAAVPTALGAGVAGLTHVTGSRWLTLPVEALAYAAGTVGGYHVAAFLGLAVVEAAAVAWLGNAVLAAAPLSTLTRPPVGLGESTVDRLESIRESLGALRAKLLLSALFAASVGAVGAAAFPAGAGAVGAAVTALAPLHGAVWVAIAGLATAWVGLRLWRAAGRWSPAGVIDRLAKAAGGIAAVGTAAIVTTPPVWRAVTAALPPEVATTVAGAASGVGSMTLLLAWVGFALVATLAGWMALVVGLLAATPLLPERAGGFAVAAAALFGVGLLGGLSGAGYAATFLLVAAALFVWDAGEHAAAIGDLVGRSGAGRQVQLVHLAAGGLVAAGAVVTGLAASAVAPAVGALASPGAAVLAVALLLSAALLLVTGLSPDADAGVAVETDDETTGAADPNAGEPGARVPGPNEPGESRDRRRDRDVEPAVDRP